MKEKYPVLIGHSARACKKLFTMEQVAGFICEQGLYGEVTIETPEGLMLISTYGIYLDKVTDFHFEFLGQMSMIRYVDNPSEIVKDEAEWFLAANQDLVRCIIQEHDVIERYLKEWESVQDSNSHKQQEESVYEN